MAYIYVDARKNCGLKVGDYVRVECAAQDREIIGKTGRILEILPEIAVVYFETLKSKYHLPYLVLTKADKPVNGECPFKTFDKVLVRDSDKSDWKPAFFGYCKNNKLYGRYIVAGGIPYNYCIPFEGNEKLIGTTDNSE